MTASGGAVVGSIAIVGLEFDDRGRLEAAAVERLRTADTVVIASDEHAAAKHVRELGIAAVTFGALGLPAAAPAGMIVEALLSLAEKGDVALVSGSYPSRSAAAPDGFDELVRIIAVLRGPDGCPWDREQTHESLGKHLIEEAYETLAAIEAEDSDELADELGDVLLQVVLHSQIAAEENRFAIEDVIARIIAKIRRRHPHIFGTVQADTSEQVMRNWDAIKRGEKEREGVLSGVAPTLPALMYAQKISRRAAGAGFDWDDIDGVWAKVHEEIDELKATEAGSPEAADEVGDLLFTVVNVARKLGVDAEDALRRMCVRFERRFEDMERAVAERETDFHDLDLGEMEELWQQAKHRESANGGE